MRASCCSLVNLLSPEMASLASAVAARVESVVMVIIGVACVAIIGKRTIDGRRVSELGFATEDGFTNGIQWPADSGADNRAD